MTGPPTLSIDWLENFAAWWVLAALGHAFGSWAYKCFIRPVWRDIMYGDEEPEWVKCHWCDQEPTHTGVYPGCRACNGDCGDEERRLPACGHHLDRVLFVRNLKSQVGDR